MISGKTTLIGHWLSRPSRSRPVIYNPWFEKNDIDAVVVPMGVKPEEYREFFPLMFKMSNIRGALVTMPHKVVTTELVDELTPIARLSPARPTPCWCARTGRCWATNSTGRLRPRGQAQGLRRHRQERPGRRQRRRRIADRGVAGRRRDHPHRPVRPVHRGVRGAGRTVEQVLPGRRGRDRLEGPGRLRPGGQRDAVGHEGRRSAADGHRPDRPDHLRRGCGDEADDHPVPAGGHRQGLPDPGGKDMLFEQIPAYLEFFGYGTTTPDELRAVAQIPD